MTVSKETWSAKFVRTLTVDLRYAPRLRLHRCGDLDSLTNASAICRSGQKRGATNKV